VGVMKQLKKKVMINKVLPSPDFIKAFRQFCCLRILEHLSRASASMLLHGMDFGCPVHVFYSRIA
jgi:hypothetical protein